MDPHRVLVVDHGGEDLGVLGRDGRVAFDQLGEQAALRLDPQRQRRDVEQHQVLDVAAQDAALDRGAHRHHLVGIDVAVRLAAEDPLDGGGDQRRAGLAAHQQHLVDLVRPQVRLAQRVQAWSFGARDQVLHQLLEMGAGQAARQVAGPRRVGRDERQVDRRVVGARQLALGPLGRLLEPLQRHAVAAQLDAGLGAEIVDQPVHDALVEVLAAEEGVAGGGAHLEDALRQLEDRDVEGAAPQVVDGDDLVVVAAVEAVGERRRRRLVEDAQHVEAGDLAGVLGRLALRIVEVGRDGDHRLADLLLQALLDELLDLAQDQRRDLLRAVLAVADLDLDVAVAGPRHRVGEHLARLADLGVVVLAADQALDREHRVLRVGDRLALGDRAHQPVPFLGEGDDRGGGAAALAVGQHARLGAVHDRDAAVGRPEVDADDLGQERDPGSPGAGAGWPGWPAWSSWPFWCRPGRSGGTATLTIAGRSSRSWSM